MFYHPLTIEEIKENLLTVYSQNLDLEDSN